MPLPKGEAAAAMRRMPPAERNAAIEAADNVLDGRGRFEHAQKQAHLSRVYRKPQKPEGAA